MNPSRYSCAMEWWLHQKTAHNRSHPTWKSTSTISLTWDCGKRHFRVPKRAGMRRSSSVSFTSKWKILRRQSNNSAVFQSLFRPTVHNWTVVNCSSYHGKLLIKKTWCWFAPFTGGETRKFMSRDFNIFQLHSQETARIKIKFSLAHSGILLC